ncbi:LOW QUALITY PROTEIN: kinesin-like protein KIF23 [Dermatophagoides pteronyssinus]|uniref:LOW QUALITY PROTEIN: kinesin-like protein KIF23 n=1 Tax=Dermatophagoides pteronyssinus TaxID=6956 RepID=UPI003F6706CF
MKTHHSDSAKKPPPPTKPKPKMNTNEKEPLQVYCRLRPLKNLNDTCVVHKINDQLLELSPPGQPKQFYKFTKVFDTKYDQHSVFKQTAFSLVKDLIDGQNGLLFSYGVTSSGKTYTITGSPQNPGIVPRTLDTIFNTLNKNGLQNIRYGFKPNNQNGFEIVSAPDAILKMQNEVIYATPNKNPRTPRKRDAYDWENRVQEEMFIKDINCDNKYSVFVSYVEVYNNFIYDLLDDQLETNKCSKRIVEDAQKRYYVQGAKEIEVKSSQEAFELCIKGMKRRRIGTTKLNNESSRSHSVFNIRLVQAPLDIEGVEVIDDSSLIRVSQLSIVDLAGCERTSRTQATGNRLREASNINNSLLTLRQCFDVLRENQKSNGNKIVPYRDNKLTHMFKSYFEGDGKVEMIICVNPGLEDYDETLHVCKFGEASQDLVTNRGSPFKRTPLRPISNFFIASSINIGPPLPNNYIEDPSDNETLKNWIMALEKRAENHEQNRIIVDEYQQNVRQTIFELNQNNTLMEQQNSVLKMDLVARENQLREYENKFSHMKREYEDTINRMQHQIDELQQELSTVNHRLATTEIEKSNLRNEFRHYKRSTKECWKSEFKRLQKHFMEKVQEAESQMEKKIATNQEKLQLLRTIINNEDDLEFIRPPWMSPLKSKPDTEIEQAATTNAAATIDARSPPVVNPRHRRSLSTDDAKWIEHRPPGTMNLGTVFQPNITSKRKKSVTNLKTSDFVGKSNEIASKYALTHHAATETGGVETKVYKGDVLPSITGGSQVIFNDVEKLVQFPCESDEANITIRKNRKRLAEMFDRMTTTTTSSSARSTPTVTTATSSEQSEMITLPTATTTISSNYRNGGGVGNNTPTKRKKYLQQ